MSFIAGGIAPTVLMRIKDRAIYNIAYDVEHLAKYSAHGSLGETPIERALLIAVMMQVRVAGFKFTATFPIRLDEEVEAQVMKATHSWPIPNNVLFFQMQPTIIEWRADFLFAVKNAHNAVSRLYVECDGHDFHERDKEQAKRDRSRDRQVQEAGYTIFRFTGSEIHNTPCECADTIVSWALNELQYGHQRNGRFY